VQAAQIVIIDGRPYYEYVPKRRTLEEHRSVGFRIGTLVESAIRMAEVRTLKCARLIARDYERSQGFIHRLRISIRPCSTR
jgi:hypothetical protein